MPTDPMMFTPLNFCPKCKNSSVELYSWHNYPQKYTRMLKDLHDGKPLISLNKYTIYTMKCSNCGEKFDIVWKNGFPNPMRGTFYKDFFMSEFKDHSIQGRPKLTESSYKIRMEE